MNIDINKGIVKRVVSIVTKYNHEKYWRTRSEVINPNSKKPKLIRLLYLLRIKHCDMYHNASMGTGFGEGAVFDTPPYLFHGLNGIIIGYNAHFGKNVAIAQQVTVMQANAGCITEIGDNVLLGAGCKVFGGVKIGNNAKIGANAVVTKDIPENAIAVGVPAKVIGYSEIKQKEPQKF